MNEELNELRAKKAEWLQEAKRGGGLLDAALQVVAALGEDITEDQYYRSPRWCSERVTGWAHEQVSIRVFTKSIIRIRDASGKMISNTLRTVQITASEHLVCDIQVGPRPDPERDDFWVPGNWEEVLSEAVGPVRTRQQKHLDELDRLELEKLQRQLLIGAII